MSSRRKPRQRINTADTVVRLVLSPAELRLVLGALRTRADYLNATVNCSALPAMHLRDGDVSGVIAEADACDVLAEKLDRKAG